MEEISLLLQPLHKNISLANSTPKIALLSDIHGNACALRAVLEEVREAGISTLLIAGDFVGYYYDVVALFRLLEPFHVIACKGNHEVLFKEWINGASNFRDKILSKYGHGLFNASLELSQSQIEWLLNLSHPVTYSCFEKKILLSHGSPWDLDIYLYEDTIHECHEKFKSLALEYDVTVIGHSHYQFFTTIDDMLVISPGSVGQPRSGRQAEINDGKARAQWGILDIQNEHLELKTTFYDITKLLREIELYDNTLPYLKNVLFRR